MQKQLLSLQEFVWVAIVGCIVTPAALWFFARFVHSSKVVSVLSLALMAPYVGMTRWGKDLPDWSFWAVFVLAQAVYLVVVYLVLRAVVRRLRSK